MSHILRKLVVFLKTYGVRRTLFWIYFGYLKRNKFLLYMRNTDDPFPGIEHRKDITIKHITLEELRAFRKNNLKLPEEFFCDEFAGTKTCFVGFVKGKVAHIMWVFLAKNGSRFFTLKDDEAEINFIHTIKEYRGQNLYPLTVREVNKWLKEKNYKALYIASHEKNINSIHAIVKCGFKKIGEVNHIGFWRPKLKGEIYQKSLNVN